MLPSLLAGGRGLGILAQMAMAMRDEGVQFADDGILGIGPFRYDALAYEGALGGGALSSSVVVVAGPITDS